MTSKARQIALPLSAAMSAASSGDARRIVLGKGNWAVAEALQAAENWPFHTAVLAGPPRSGKSLFARWFTGLGEGAGRGQAIDDADRMDETELFHLWNRAQEAGRSLLLTRASGPWDIRLPDLRSRMGAALQLTISAPDDAMLAELIVEHASARGVPIPEGASAYLVPRATRDYAAIETLVETIDRLSLERKQPATLAIWRDALDILQGGDPETDQPDLL